MKGENMDQLAATILPSTNDQTELHDLFSLSDEQILEINPEKEVAPHESRVATREAPAKQSPPNRADAAAPTATASSSTSHESLVTTHDSAEPPAWLAAQMNDPWGGEEAREFWDGVQQARSEAAAYRAAIASPEDAQALKELYPGGVSEARVAAERARLLDDVDRAYFGAAGNSPEQTSASRAQLAQRMLREDPAAFREMVEAGIRVLQEAAGSHSQGTRSLALAVSDIGNAAADGGPTTAVAVAQHSLGSARDKAAPLQENQPNAATAGAVHNDAHVAAYAAFERAANEDLERSVGIAIERTLAQALPSFKQQNTPGQSRLGEQAGAQRAAPLRDRLAASVRVDVEKALQGDRQLGEQVAQILSSRRFDNDARAQIVRLISERAQQLVPGAAKRVLNEWTQTTLAAHRGRTQHADLASARAEVAPASAPVRPAGNERAPARRQDASRSSGQASATRSQPVNYRKLSDEQILEM
jgi:hypothetical protein